MNLFVLDEDPVKAAQGLDDKRVGKLLMEANQMLSVAVNKHSERPKEYGVGLLCRGGYQRHPVTLWVGATRSNWLWALQHARALADEWQYRFDMIHGSALRLPYIATFADCLPAGHLLQFQNSARNEGVGLDYSHLPVVEAYRLYIQERWKTDSRPVTFRKRGFPSWARSML